MTTYYLSGPMEGYPEHNYPTFHEAEEALASYLTNTMIHDGRDETIVIDNPARHWNGDRSLPREKYMLADLQSVLNCDVIVMLPGWRESEGAGDEARVAHVTGKRFMAATHHPVNRGPQWTFADIDFFPATASEPPSAAVRTFASGATRDIEDGKWDFEAFLSPAVLDAFAAYMHKHRERQDGSLRDGDDWQKGIPMDVYMKSMWRHFMDVWRAHRKLTPNEDQLTSLMALLFNVQGYAFELLKGQALREKFVEAAKSGRVEILDG